MEFRTLMAVAAVAREGSVSAAARKLQIAQPTVSHALSAAEQELGIPLFERDHHPLRLTPAGERCAAQALRILRTRAEGMREIRAIAGGAAGRIRIGITTERAGYMLPKVLGPFREACPHVQIHLQESRSDEIVEMLRRGTISLAILAGGSERDFPAGMDTELLYREPLYLVASRELITERMLVPDDRYRDGLPTVELSQMREVPFFLLPEGMRLRRCTDTIFHQAQFFPAEVMEASSGSSSAQLAQAGLGAAIVPERCRFGAEGVRREALFHYSRGAMDHWEIRIVRRKDVELTEAQGILIRVLREVFGRPQEGEERDGESADGREQSVGKRYTES